MTSTHLPVFDQTLQTTNGWIAEIMADTGVEDRHRAYSMLRATLHALRDRLSVDENAQLSAQLPMLVRGIYFEGWDPSDRPGKPRHKEAFIDDVMREARDPDYEPEPAVKAVFKVLARHVSPGEIEDVRHLLPAEIREMWPRE